MNGALRPDEVHVWFRETDTPPGQMTDEGDGVLSADECAKRDRFHFPDDRRDYACAHDLLRRSLSRYADVAPQRWRFVAGPQGKPFIDNGTLSFNLSHTRGFVACGVTRIMAVGIDVERSDRIAEVEGLAERFLAPAERDAIRTARCGPRARFVDLWTLKEAFIKAVGTGLAQSLDTFSFDLERHERRINFAAPPGFDAAEWQFALYEPRPNVRLAIAAQAPDGGRIGWCAYECKPGGFAPLDPARTS